VVQTLVELRAATVAVTSPQARERFLRSPEARPDPGPRVRAMAPSGRSIRPYYSWKGRLGPRSEDEPCILSSAR
jgi:hypothetical protein